MTLAPAVGWTASYFERFRIGVSLDELETDILKSLDDYIKARHDSFTSTRETNEWKTW